MCAGMTMTSLMAGGVAHQFAYNVADGCVHEGHSLPSD